MTHNIGFHIRIPFHVNTAGVYQFRIHADYGRGSFLGVDGAEHTPGNSWGHMQLEPAVLSKGDHEFEALGFEDCCDGHSELEVHLPCDKYADPWRMVIAGPSDCLKCGGKTANWCTAQTKSAGFCGSAGSERPVQIGDNTGKGTKPIGSRNSHCVNAGNTGRTGGTKGYEQGK